MLTISKPLSAAQARTLSRGRVPERAQNYYTEGDQIRGEWHGRLAAQWGLSRRGAEDAVPAAR